MSRSAPLDRAELDADLTPAARRTPAARAIAFYLPQFHRIEENDAWWGPGFTEWTNTAKARPLYRGHHQPHLPADLGFYDLRLAETRAAQAELATRYGIEAFCYWHYWFGGGRRLLERPFAEVLATGEPRQKFCLGWANQTWTGVWHGAPDRVLVEQTYPGPEDDLAHFRLLESAFHDPRYLTVRGRPVFYVFRPEGLPDPEAFVDRWQAMAVSSGLPGLYLVAEVSDLLGHGPRFGEPAGFGFDAGAYLRLPAKTTGSVRLLMRLRRRLFKHPERYAYSPTVGLPPRELKGNYHPTVYPNWDNTPRSGRRGLVLDGSCPELFEQAARQAVSSIGHRPAEERLLFVKSWNEWAEGNYLEPDLDHGHAHLRALARALDVHETAEHSDGRPREGQEPA